jgi:hypothetical protein
MKLTKPVQRLLVGFGVACYVAVAVWVGDKGWRSWTRADTVGCVYALEAACLSELDAENPQILAAFPPHADGRRFLEPEEYDRVIAELDKTHNLDPPRRWTRPDPLVDPWGSRFEIGYCTDAAARYDLSVVSRGPDGVLGTKDDVSRQNH